MEIKAKLTKPYTEDERMGRKKEMLKIINKIERYLKNGK